MNGQNILPSSEQSPYIRTTVFVTASLTMILATLLQLAFRKRKQTDQTRQAKNIDSIDQKKYPNGEVTVYFGTQTGTAEAFARDLEREGRHQGVYVHVVDLEHVTDLKMLNGKCCIFLTSVYGEGEPPDNAVEFTKLLNLYTGIPVLQPTMTTTTAKTIAAFEYCVFGLGNRQYDHFNAIGKYFDTALLAIGGERTLPLGLGDDDADLETDFENWKKMLWAEILRKYGTDVSSSHGSSSVEFDTALPEIPMLVDYHETAKPNYGLPSDQIHTSSRHYFTATETSVHTIRQLQGKGSDKSTIHMELQATLPYETADNLGVLPQNPTSLVNRLLERLSYDGDAIISLSPKETAEWQGTMFPQPDTLRNILTQYYDLQAPPRRSDLKLYSRYCSNDIDRQCLLRLASDRAEYKQKIMLEFMGIVDILEKMPSLRFPLEHFLHHIPLLQPRYFTIASSNKVHKDSIHLTVAVTKQEKQSGDFFLGLCSNYLAHPHRTKLRVFVRPSSFRLPNDINTPMILIGPGTGIAPMRAFLQERSLQDVEKRGKTILYFGCHKEDKDYLYKEELEEFKTAGVLDDLRVAFSRQGGAKVYVQHLLQFHSEETANLIVNQNAHVYVCGAVQMGHDVNEVLQKILKDQVPTVAKDYLDDMSQQGRYVQELWA